MKTHIDLDGELLEKVQALGGYTTKRQAVDAALRDHMLRLTANQLRSLRGKFAGEGDLVVVDDEPRFPEWER